MNKGRPGGRSLSVTWCEYFEGTDDQVLRCAIEAIRGSMRAAPKACFCVAPTSKIITKIQQLGGIGRAVYLPENNNPAHAGIIGIDPENALLLQALANEVWGEYLTRTTADQLPMTECTKSRNVQ